MAYPYGGMNMVQPNHVINDRIAYIRYNASMVFLPCFYCTLYGVQGLYSPCNRPRDNSPAYSVRALQGRLRASYGYAVQCIYIIVLIAQGYISMCTRVGDKVTFTITTTTQKPTEVCFLNNRLWSVLRIDFGLFSMPGSCIFPAYSVYNRHSLYHMAGI